MTNAPFSAPDESQHYLRAIGVSAGTLIGAPAHYNGPRLSPKETAWRVKLTRAVTVPPRLSPVGFECELFHPDVTPACARNVKLNAVARVEQTDVGRYGPLPYLLPATVLTHANDPATADRYARLITVLVWLALLSAAVWMLWDRRAGGLSLAGLIVAVTPTVVFMGSSLSDSSLEIVASIAFFAGLLRLARRPASTQRAIWGAVAISGTLLVLSRSLGSVWMVCDVLIAVFLAGPSQLRELASRRRRALALTSGAILLAIGLDLVWEKLYGPKVAITVIPALSALHDGAWQLRGALTGLIGLFGYQDVPLGSVGIGVWAIMTAALVGAGAWAGRRNERRGIAVAVALSVLVPIYLYAALTSHQGIQTQGRHLLPLFVTIPLVAGEVLRRQSHELGQALARSGFPLLCIGAAVIQLLGWWVNSRRYAVGLHGPWWFLSSADWQPPGEWAIWVALMLTGFAVVIVTSVLRVRTRSGGLTAENAVATA